MRTTTTALLMTATLALLTACKDKEKDKPVAATPTAAVVQTTAA